MFITKNQLYELTTLTDEGYAKDLLGYGNYMYRTGYIKGIVLSGIALVSFKVLQPIVKDITKLQYKMSPKSKRKICVK